MPKVGLLIASLRTGGKETMTVNILNHLDRTRFDPFLCVMKEGELLERLKDVRVYSHLTRFRGDVPGFMWRLFQILRRERPQILLCLSYRIPGWVGRILGKLLGIPVIIYELHGVTQVGKRNLELPDRLIFDYLTDHMIAIGEAFRQNLIRDGVAPQKITVIPNGVDTDFFSPAADKGKLKCDLLGLMPDTPVIGCITKMRPEKNLAMLVDAFALVRKAVPDAKLVFVGDGSERSTVEARIRALNLQEHVLLLGLRRDTADLINTFDIAVLSSATEAAPLAILEAEACGIPVVATAVGEIPDMVIDGESGFLVPSGDTTAFAARLITLLTDSDLRKQMSQAARAHITAHYSIHANVRAREALFLKLLSGL